MSGFYSKNVRELGSQVPNFLERRTLVPISHEQLITKLVNKSWTSHEKGFKSRILDLLFKFFIIFPPEFLIRLKLCKAALL